MKALSALVLAPAFLAGCTIFASPPVARRLHNATSEGRFVDDTAYAAYGEGALAEASRDLDAAERAYLRAIAADDANADAWTRVGAVRCARGERAGAEDAFQRAAALDVELASVFFERARCSLARGELDRARGDAARALTLDPPSLEGAMLVAEIAERRGDLAEAGRYRTELRARAAGNEAIARVLAARAPRPVPVVADLDRALVAGDRALAQRLAVALRILPGTLALRAVALGKAELAAERAELVLAADPADADARVALLAAADLLGDRGAFALALRAMPGRARTTSPLGELLLVELLRRRVGPEAAGQIARETHEDPLVDRVRTRAAR